MTYFSGSKFFGCFEKHPKVVSGALRDGSGPEKFSGLLRNARLACVSQKTRKLLGPEDFSGLFSGEFFGSRKAFLNAPENSPDSHPSSLHLATLEN